MTNYDVIIAGAGPAGSSAAIHLAKSGARVLLAEQKNFPRAKLCGEFISPECLLHFQKLGVDEEMLAAKPAKLSTTVFYSRSGKAVTVPSSWFDEKGFALGLSRAEMDERLLRHAAKVGVDVRESTVVTDLIIDDKEVRGVIARHENTETQYRAPITVDATGRSRSLARLIDKTRARKAPRRPAYVAFKAHLRDARVATGTCEIYFYSGGYGGLSTIENGISNLCFIASSHDVRACGADAERVMREIVCQNVRAAVTLAAAQPCSDWLAVSLESFGRHSLQPAKGLLAIGDAASFIDPFTGSGMLMAFESGELLSAVLADRLTAIRGHKGIDAIAEDYRARYAQQFGRRLWVCSAMRRAAFVPGLASVAILFFRSDALRHQATLATRFQSH